MSALEKKWTLGLMSGTSIDGIDVAALHTDGEQSIAYGPTLFVPYENTFKQRIKSILGSTERNSSIDTIEKDLTNYHYKAVLSWLQENKFSSQDIDLIGFHGHTILHRSPKKYSPGRTWQIGNGQELADLLEIPVIGNLRENDIQHGGEGAPLVPIFHQTLCASLLKPVAIFNIGGIANITYVGEGQLIAFDTGPGNGLMDQSMEQHTGQFYDQDGSTARKGCVDSEWLKEQLQDPYFNIPPPKSLDRLDFNKLPTSLSLEDGMATLLSLTVESVAKSLMWVPIPPQLILIAGGGRRNTYLMEQLQKRLNPIQVLPIDTVDASSDFLEAQAWAYLAKRSFNKLPITFPSTTGVKEPLTGGTLYYPQSNFQQFSSHSLKISV